MGAVLNKYLIIHIEDEAQNVGFIPSRIRNLIYKFLQNCTGEDVTSIVYTPDLSNKFPKKDQVTWKYNGSRYAVNYWFVRELTELCVIESKEKIDNNTVFILDAMRPNSSGRLESSLKERYSAVQQYFSSQDQATSQIRVYTAYPGVSKDPDLNHIIEFTKGGEDIFIFLLDRFGIE